MAQKINFFACAPPACKCPEVDFDGEDTVFIKDDWGGTISITDEQMDIIAFRWMEERGHTFQIPKTEDLVVKQGGQWIKLEERNEN